MKTAPLFLLLLISFQFSGQDYKMINASAKKLFAAWPGAAVAYSLSVESSKVAGTDSVYYNFFDLNPEAVESDTCEFWLGNRCSKQNYPVCIS